ncbi:unnamed protein product, partial [Prorocentrum cordatum]
MAPPPLDVASPRLAGGGLRGALSAPGGSTLVGRAPAPTAGATLPHAMRAWLERCASSPHAGERRCCRLRGRWRAWRCRWGRRSPLRAPRGGSRCLLLWLALDLVDLLPTILWCWVLVLKRRR